jgi:hypothetical protein
MPAHRDKPAAKRTLANPTGDSLSMQLDTAADTESLSAVPPLAVDGEHVESSAYGVPSDAQQPDQLVALSESDRCPPSSLLDRLRLGRWIRQVERLAKRDPDGYITSCRSRTPQ